MRFILVLFLCVLSSAAFAAEQKTVTTPTASAPTNPIDALKKSLHKEDKAAPVATKKNIPVVKTWMSLPRAERIEVLQAWLAMPETTRSPFPVYRDSILEGNCNAGKACPPPRPLVKTSENNPEKNSAAK